jgi:3-isopropylmalate/(R)-2-methylmalate dehydratase small subunit
LLEVSGVHNLVETGDRIRVDVRAGIVENLTSGKSVRGNPPPEFLLEMVQAGGLIALLKTGSRFFLGPQ